MVFCCPAHSSRKFVQHQQQLLRIYQPLILFMSWTQTNLFAFSTNLKCSHESVHYNVSVRLHALSNNGEGSRLFSFTVYSTAGRAAAQFSQWSCFNGPTQKCLTCVLSLGTVSMFSKWRGSVLSIYHFPMWLLWFPLNHTQTLTRSLH